MLDAEIYVDRIADMRIHDMNAVLEATRQMVLAKRKGEEEDLYSRTLALAQVQEEEYFAHMVSKDMAAILHDIRTAHKADSTTADVTSTAAQMQKQLEDAVNFEGSAQENKIRVYFASIGLDHDTLTKEEFVAIISALKKSKLLDSPTSQRGKVTLTHGKGKRKKR